MRKKSLSTLGYIMEALNIQTVSMSRSIHVDASLVSKWKTGDRNLSPKSVYFDDIIDFIMEESTNTIHHTLKIALLNLYPHETIETESQIDTLLRQALSSSNQLAISNATQLNSDNKNTVSAITFQDNNGRREAIIKLLDYAEAMKNPGDMIFIDHEEFNWLLEDKDYTKMFVTRVENLIHKGFHATFVMHYTSYKDQIIKLFDVCSSLIFHRNIDWYYNEYYDNTGIDFSFFILNNALSLLGFSSNSFISSTMVFTDTSIVMQHEFMAKHIIEHCEPIFSDFKINNINDVLTDVSRFRKTGTLYCYLPSPVFLFSTKQALCDIISNQVNENMIRKCLDLNNHLKKIMKPFFFSTNTSKKESIIYIFQYEELLHRASRYTAPSTSLSVLCGQTIMVTAKQYAQELRNLSKLLLDYDNISVVLASTKDNISLPKINCWCQKDLWMVQMNQNGLRLSSEFTMINAASTKWERCIRSIPSQRKEKNSVSQFLLELANRCDNIQTPLHNA